MHANKCVMAQKANVTLKPLSRPGGARMRVQKRLIVLRRGPTFSNFSNFRHLMNRNAKSLYEDDRATLDELREAVTTFEDAGRIARRVLGGAHPLTLVHESNLQDAQAALRARETPPTKGES